MPAEQGGGFERKQLLDIHVQLLDSLLKETGSFLRLLLGLCTGAIALFVTLLSRSDYLEIASAMAMLASVAFFAAVISRCLTLVVQVLQLRGTFASVLAAVLAGTEPQTQEEFQGQVNSWTERTKKDAEAAGRLFRAAVILAAVFLALLCFDL